MYIYRAVTFANRKAEVLTSVGIFAAKTYSIFMDLNTVLGTRGESSVVSKAWIETLVRAHVKAWAQLLLSVALEVPNQWSGTDVAQHCRTGVAPHCWTLALHPLNHLPWLPKY